MPTDIVLNESPAAPEFCGDPHPCNTPPLNAGAVVRVGDQRYGLSQEFWSWYHRQVKQPGDPDLNKQDAERWYRVWEEEGEPDAEGHRTKMEGVLPLPDVGGVPLSEPGLFPVPAYPF